MEYQFSERVRSLKPSAIREILKNSSDPSVIPLSAGNPAPDAFPYDAVSALSADLLQNAPIDALQYGVTEGYAPLRKHLMEYMGKKHQVGTENDDILITRCIGTYICYTEPLPVPVGDNRKSRRRPSQPLSEASM